MKKNEKEIDKRKGREQSRVERCAFIDIVLAVTVSQHHSLLLGLVLREEVDILRKSRNNRRNLQK